MKSCFEELHTFLYINAGRYFFFGSQNQGGGVLKNFKQPRDLTVKEIKFFDENL